MPQGPYNEIKDNEFNDLVAKGWLVEGTAADVGKFQLTAKGLEQFNRLNLNLDAKSQVLIGLKLAANVFTTPAAIKAFMKQ